MNKLNLSDDKVNALLAMAGKKLGKSPEALKASLQSGDMAAVLNGMSPGDRERVNSVLKNPGALDSLLQNEQIKKLLGNKSV